MRKAKSQKELRDAARKVEAALVLVLFLIVLALILGLGLTLITADAARATALQNVPYVHTSW